MSRSASHDSGTLMTEDLDGMSAMLVDNAYFTAGASGQQRIPSWMKQARRKIPSLVSRAYVWTREA